MYSDTFLCGLYSSISWQKVSPHPAPVCACVRVCVCVCVCVEGERGKKSPSDVYVRVVKRERGRRETGRWNVCVCGSSEGGKKNSTLFKHLEEGDA